MQRAASDKTRRHLGSGRGPTSAAKNPKTALWRSRRTVAAAPMPVTWMGGKRTSSLSCYVLLAPSSASLTPKVATQCGSRTPDGHAEPSAGVR